MVDSYTKNKWQGISTVNDLIDYMEDPSCDVMGMSDHLVDISKSAFWTAANVNFDFDFDRYIKETPKKINYNELSTNTMVPSEIKRHEKYNYGNGYDKIAPDDNARKIARAIGFNEGSSIWINNQPPGAVTGRHVDFIGTFTYENRDDIGNMKYDKELRQPKELKTIWRCFVALDDWHPGQIVNFEPNFWTEWKKGDVVFFDWRNTPHALCNGGFYQRPFLKITGVLDDDGWIAEAQRTGEVKQVVVEQ